MVAFLVGLALGGAFGWLRAVRRDGTVPDRIQYALAHGIPTGLVFLAAALIAARVGWLT